MKKVKRKKRKKCKMNENNKTIKFTIQGQKDDQI